MLTIVTTNLLRRSARTALTASGIALGVATIVALLSLTQGLRRTASGFVHLGGSDIGVFQSNVSDPTTSILPEVTVSRLARLEQVARATALLLIVEGVRGEPAAVAFGADPAGFFTRSLVLVEGGLPATGGAPRALVGERLAASQHLHPGARVTIRGHSFQVAGVYHSGILFEDSGVVLPLAAAQRLVGRPREVTSVVADLTPGTGARTAGRAIEAALPGTQVISDPQQALRAGANGTLISKAVLVIVVIALVVGAISVANTMAMSILERQAEIGLLGAVGWSSRRVAVLILGEGVAVSFLGAGVGLLFGDIGAGLLIKALGVSSYVSPSLTAWVFGRGLLVGIAIGVLGGIYPAWRVTRMTPLRALASR